MHHDPDFIIQRHQAKATVQRRFLEKMRKQKSIGKNSPNLREVHDSWRIIETEKKRRKAAQKKIKQLTGKLKQLKEQTEKLEQEKRKLKKRLRQVQAEKEEIRKDNAKLKAEADELSHALDYTKRELAALKAECEHEDVQKLKANLRRSSQRNGDLLEHNHRLKLEVAKLKQKIKTRNTLLEDDSSVENHPAYKALKEELAQVIGKLRKLEARSDIPGMIETLHQRLSIETVDSYNIDTLVSRVQNLSKRKNELHRQERLHDWMIRHLMEEDNIEPGVLGFLTTYGENWFFSDLNGTVYPVSTFVTGQLPTDDLPARAEIVDESAIIHKVYNIGAPSEGPKTLKKKSRMSVKKDNDDYPSFGPFTVLIIGSQNKNKYVERLRKHGLTVMWHDPFEESHNRLKDKYHQADVVVVCTSHTSHSVLDHVDINNSRVELVKRDSEEALVARVRYALIQTKKLVTGRS